MRVVALTGGIASGKSMACRMLQEAVSSGVIFDCDAMVHRLLEADEEIAEKVRATFGEAAVERGERLNRSFLREAVFSDGTARLKLEAILHPRVRQECLDSLEDAAKKAVELFIADVPLLFEKGFDFGQTQVIVVASSRATQIRRLKARNGFDDSLIESILQAQLPVEEKIARADIVFWNEGPPLALKSQILRYSQEFS
ncbi:MAG: dephospho-CoA kinase [Fibrobacteria bacterium]